MESTFQLALGENLAPELDRLKLTISLKKRDSKLNARSAQISA
jgi:hypothetical protein